MNLASSSILTEIAIPHWLVEAERHLEILLMFINPGDNEKMILHDVQNFWRARIMLFFLTLVPGLFVSVAISAPSTAQEFRYEFRDTPRPEAEVIVVRHSLEPGPGSDFYVTGRLFNRGLKVANNVRVVVTVTNKYGARYPMNPIYLIPSDIPATSFADFEGRLLSITDPRDVFVQIRAEWDQ